MKHFTTIIGASLLGLSVAHAAPEASKDPTLLSASQMDGITAGFAAFATVNAAGISQIYSTTQTNVVALAAVTTTDQPQLGAVVGISGGEAQAVAVGEGSDTTTGVSSTNTITGPNVMSFTVSVQMKGQVVEISGAGTMTIGSLVTNPL